MTRTRRSGRSSLVLTFAALAAVLMMFTPASAVQSFIVAAPGASALGYTPKIVVLQKGQPATFVNLDTAPHDVRSGKPGAPNGLFQSALITIGKKTPVVGVKNLPRGSFAFFCTIHPIMKGTLRVI